MTHKQIDFMRETRLWLGQIIIPAMGIILTIPESRESVISGFKNVKYSLNRKWIKLKNKS